MGNLQEEGRLRPVDLAREHGLSTQAIRNYEADGVLPAAERTASGYRTYTPLHALALRAFLALIPGHGHRTAAAIMQAVNRDATAEALRLIDESHTQLLADRGTLTAVESALRTLELEPSEHAASPGGGVPSRRDHQAAPGHDGRSSARGRDLVRSWRGFDPTPASRGEIFVGPLARRLGVRPATLRKWERAGLVEPRRDPRTGYRVYDDADVRDALLTHQLRRGGFPLERIAEVNAQVRAAGDVDRLESTLDDWHDRLDVRGRAMLAGAAALDAYLSRRPPPVVR